ADDKGYREYVAEKGRALDRSGADDAFDAAWCLHYFHTTSVDKACLQANKLSARGAAHVGTRPPVDVRGIIPATPSEPLGTRESGRRATAGRPSSPAA